MILTSCAVGVFVSHLRCGWHYINSPKLHLQTVKIAVNSNEEFYYGTFRPAVSISEQMIHLPFSLKRK